MSNGEPIERIALSLATNASCFTRAASRRPGEKYSLVAMRTLGSLEHEGGMRIGEMAAHERVTQPTITAIVNRLEQDGLVSRRTDADDARGVIVEITPAGTAELGAYRHRTAERVRPVLEALDEQDVAVLTRATELFGILAERLRP